MLGGNQNLGRDAVSDTVGYVLLGAAGIATAFGWDLSRRGLSQAKTAAQDTKEAANQLQEQVAAAQPALAQATGAEAANLAQAHTGALQTANRLRSAADEVSSALAALTGVFAPARVAFALAFLLVAASLVALDLISLSVADEAPETPTTTTTATPP